MKHTLLWISLVALVPACKSSQSDADLSFDAASAAAFATAAKGLDAATRNAICGKTSLVVFIGNGESQGRPLWIDGLNPGPAEAEQTKKFQDDFQQSIAAAERNLIETISRGTLPKDVCPDSSGPIQLLSIVDGPGQGDTIVTRIGSNKQTQKQSVGEFFLPDVAKFIDAELSRGVFGKIDQIVYIIKSHGGRMTIDGRPTQVLLLDPQGPGAEKYSDVYYHNLHTFGAYEALCKQPIDAKNARFCAENRSFDPRMSSIAGGNSSGVGSGNSSGVGSGNSSSVAGGNSSGVGVGGSSGIGGGNSSGVKGTGNSSGVEGTGNSSGIKSAASASPDLGQLVIGDVKRIEPNFTKTPDPNKPQGSLQVSRGAFYGVDLKGGPESKLAAAGFVPLRLSSQSVGSDPIMLILDACVQSGQAAAAMRSDIFGTNAPVVHITSKNPIYYHAIQYQFVSPVLLRFLPFLVSADKIDAGLRQRIDELTTSGVDREGVESKYGKQSDFDDASLQLCIGSSQCRKIE